MGHTDLRDWLKVVESHGELKHITGAEWDLEMSGIVEMVYREGKDPKPLLIFDDIPGYPKGYRTLFGLLSSPWRIARTLGLPEDELDHNSLLRNWREKRKELRLIPPMLVTSGPVLAHSEQGAEIDVLKFPVPRFHELESKRFIGTCHGVIQRDPETGYVNIGTYRNMVYDRNNLCLHWTPGKHGKLIMEQKYFARGKVMPIAIVIGMDPVLWWFACQGATSWQVSEYDIAGAVRGKPIELIKGPYTGLPVPANAEIVIEGECHPGELAEEGPFGEWHGYYGNRGLMTVPEQVMRVKAVHYRDDPILTCSHPTIPPNEFSLMLALSSSEGMWERLEAFGIPGIKGVWCHEVGGGMLFNVISIEQIYPGHGLQVGLIASQYPRDMGKYTVVVEEDIDPSDLKQVIWAMVTRALPDRSIHILKHTRASNVDTAIPLDVKLNAKDPMCLTASRVVIDACRDLEWKSDWYPMARISTELREKIIEKWQPVISELMKGG